MSKTDRAKRAKPVQKKRGLSRRQKWMLVGVTLLNLGLYGALFLLASPGPTATNTPALTVGEALPLRTAHGQALALALGWQADAQLTNVATSWQLAAGDALTLHRSAWSFHFYSPTAHRVKMVTVDGQGAKAGPEQSVDVAPNPAGLDWNLDSQDLLLTFLSYGGQDFIAAHPGANVHVQLKAEEIGRSTWYVTAIDPVARQSLTVGIDALSRQVLVNETDKGGG